MVSVQDESAQLASLVLAPTAQESILDACAAPGGKTGHLLELASDAHLTAIDIDSERCSRIKDNLQRLNLDAEIVCQDLVQYASEGRKFDAVYSMPLARALASFGVDRISSYCEKQQILISFIPYKSRCSALHGH